MTRLALVTASGRSRRCHGRGRLAERRRVSAGWAALLYAGAANSDNPQTAFPRTKGDRLRDRVSRAG